MLFIFTSLEEEDAGGQEQGRGEEILYSGTEALLEEDWYPNLISHQYQQDWSTSDYLHGNVVTLSPQVLNFILDVDDGNIFR